MIILAILTGISLICTLLFAELSSNNSRYEVPFKISLLAVMVSAFALGVTLERGIWETKEPVVPTIRVECLNENCDTTYIYNFNTKEK
jgi:hypothetical protein